MPTRTLPDLAPFLGKGIDKICPQGFHDSEANHCAHFVSHVGGYPFGYLCHLIAGSPLKGVTVRVQEIFPECPQVGKWDDLPGTGDDHLVFITARKNVNLVKKTIENVPRKHIGILQGGRIYHYSNGEDKVVRQTPAEVLARFRKTYADPTVELFFGTLPVLLRAAAPRGKKPRANTRAPQPADLYRVKSDTANLRSVPAILDPANLLATLPRGHIVARLAASPEPMWWQVSTLLDGEALTGYLHSGLLVPDTAAADGEVQVSEAALALILEFEGMDQPSKWPGLQSGISLGHGYDLGYHTHDEFMGDWGPHLTADQLTRLAKAIGKRGTAAKNLAPSYKDITIKVPDADAVFMRATLPKIKLWGGKTFPGITALPADAQGALVSLVYNRGTSMEGERRREMREIRDTCADPTLTQRQRLDAIAASILSMKRLWPDTPGLRRRRDAEAALVQNAT